MRKLVKRNPDTGKTIAWLALGGAVAYGVYLLIKPTPKSGIPSNLAITKYQNTRTGQTVSSGFLDVLNGDIVKVYFEYGYFGPALSGTYHISLWQKTALDPHDEVGPTDKPFDISAYSSLTKVEGSVDMEIKAGDGEYGLYMKIMGIPGGDIFTPYYTDRIRVGKGAIVGEWVQLASVDIVVKVAVVITDWVQLASVSVSVKVAPIVSDWMLLDTKSISVIPLALGEFTLDVESNPIWGGYVTKDPNKDRYAYGEIVKLTATAIWPREFDYWYLKETNEWLSSGNPINFMVLANHIVVAKF